MVELFIKAFEPTCNSRPASTGYSTGFDANDFDSTLHCKVTYMIDSDANSLRSQDLVSCSSRNDRKTVSSSGFIIGKLICNQLFGDLQKCDDK